MVDARAGHAQLRRAAAMTPCMNPLGPQTYRSRPAMSGTSCGEAGCVEAGVRARPDELVELPAALAHQVGELVAQDQVAPAGAAQDRDDVDVARQVLEQRPARA